MITTVSVDKLLIVVSSHHSIVIATGSNILALILVARESVTLQTVKLYQSNSLFTVESMPTNFAGL